MVKHGRRVALTVSVVLRNDAGSWLSLGGSFTGKKNTIINHGSQLAHLLSLNGAQVIY